ncbi:MAG: hypothetical protein JWR07_4162 [Nevskia sp.]|nr:hypothetical protein [Nevskia sp.]
MKRQDQGNKDDSGSGDRAPDIGEPVFLEAPPPRRPRAATPHRSFLSLLRLLLRGHRMEACH